MEEPQYDSTQDTINHINTVRLFLAAMIYRLEQRRMDHDASKLQEPEKAMYDEYTPLLRELTYGSDEYKASLMSMGPALAHHYQVNSHHPEHWPIPETPEIAHLTKIIQNMDEDNPAYLYLKANLAQLESRVNGMSLLDLLEMLADWKAAGMRHATGKLSDSLKINRERFHISDQLFHILENTVKEMEW